MGMSNQLQQREVKFAVEVQNLMAILLEGSVE